MASRKRKLRLAIGGAIVVLLAGIVFTVGSLKVPLAPQQRTPFVIFFALFEFVGAALLVFGLILLRTLLRLWAERRSGQMGSRFKANMVMGAMAVSLLPLLFMFFFSYALVNRTLNAWFPRPLEIANQQSLALIEEFTSRGYARMSQEAQSACALIEGPTPANLTDALAKAAPRADALWMLSPGGAVLKVAPAAFAGSLAAAHLKMVSTLPAGTEVWNSSKGALVAGSAPCGAGRLVIARIVPGDFLERYSEIQTQTQIYEQQHQHLRAYKREILLALSLITLLLMFATTWAALFLSKQVTVPIQALAEATREISVGNFDHRIHVQAQDELGMLVRSFNRMTEQLGEGRRQINEFTHSLEQAIEERERRRQLMEAILDNVPTGVVSLDSSGSISAVNPAVPAILGEHARNAHSLQDLLGEEAARAVLHLMRRSLRMGAASREIEVASGGRLVRTAVTVSSLGPRRSNPGFVVVIDDLTDLLRAQKAAAWQEVAQRIAHEIKNPLTPIQLSAQRLLRYLQRAGDRAAPGTPQGEFEKLTSECAALIEREVRTLESLVDEFSQFARFPSARLTSADVNAIVSSAIELFHGRLDGITVRTEFGSQLPPVKADPELLRRVVANLIDNAAEAMEGSAVRLLCLATRAESDGDAVAIEISDSGHGISPEDKERLFLPHFSTKDRGTGLGLAIASRIVAEHNGTIRAEDNVPIGTRFLIRFPAVDVAAAPLPAAETRT